MNLKIINVKNNSEELILIQKKLFSIGVTWNNNSKEVKEKLNVFNNDEDLILIITDNKMSWTNKKYAVNVKYSKYHTLTGSDFLKK